MNDYILLDLFSGIGGFPKGFMDAGFKFKYHYYSEINKYAIAVYKYQFKYSEYAGDVRFVSGTEIRKKHPSEKFIITFGFPCQDISNAGKRQGLNGSRSNLFFQAVRIIKEIKPDIFIFENVKGLFSSNEGKDFEKVLKTIADIGIYECEWQLLNTKWILPQNRERIYFIGHYRGKNQSRVFPIREADFLSIQTERQTQYINTLKAGRSCGLHSGMTIVDNRYGCSYLRKECPCLASTDYKKPITLKISEINNPENKTNYRRLTEIEYERFQGFPDNWTKYGIFNNEIKKISKSRRYEMLGNAVSVPIVKLIAKRLIR